MQDELNKIASQHLGRAGDGTIVKPYVTPDKVDPSLLVAVPRHLNRTAYGIDDNNLPFTGIDAWNSYEFSTLLENGFPVSGWLKFTYSAKTPNIVESKSVKLYLNSYNMDRTIVSIDQLLLIEARIAHDIGKAVQGEVKVKLGIGDIETTKPFTINFVELEKCCDIESLTFNQYNEDVNILQVIDNNKIESSLWRSHSLRSNCRVTNQPDWGDVFIYITGSKSVTPESLLQYIVSMRKENHFHEEICECIYKRLYDILKPQDLLVTCLYTRRGGIDINPTRASSNKLMLDLTRIIDYNIFTTKTSRQ